VSTHDEIQLSDDLRHLVAGHSFQADPDALLRRAQRVRRRNLATKGAAGIGVLAVAAAGTAIGLNGGAGTPQVQDAAYVAQHVSTALAEDANNVYRETNLTEGTVTYLDQTTFNQYFVAGSGDTRIVAWDTFVQVGNDMHLRDTTVNFKDHTYSTDDRDFGPAEPSSSRGSTIVGLTEQRIRSGQDKITGTGEYQGHQVIKLTIGTGTPGFELWVDAATYQPVHSVSTEPDGSTDATDLAFLPRTPDLVRTMTTPQVPAGFAKVDEASNIGHGG
jgi:hypothetical protein